MRIKELPAPAEALIKIQMPDGSERQVLTARAGLASVTLAVSDRSWPLWRISQTARFVEHILHTYSPNGECIDPAALRAAADEWYKTKEKL